MVGKKSGTHEVNPTHWMVHEAVHQINREVAKLALAQWLNEGLAEYFGTSVYKGGHFILGEIDKNTYPIWWLDTLFLSGDLEQDLAVGKVIGLREILTGKGGPDIDEVFNLYYIHWWSLTHFLVHSEDGQYRTALVKVVQEGGSLESFEKYIGPVERIEGEWYEYLCGKVQEIVGERDP
jgi:hypothetical protein